MRTGRRKRQAETREGMIVTTVAMPLEMHRRLLIAAVEVNAAVTEVLRQAVAAWLARHERRKRPASDSR